MRFCEGLLEQYGFTETDPFIARDVKERKKTSTRDGWILYRLSECVRECNDGFKEYSFAKCTNALYSFWLYELADVYVEAIKPLFKTQETKEQARKQAEMDCIIVCTD